MLLLESKFGGRERIRDKRVTERKIIIYAPADL